MYGFSVKMHDLFKNVVSCVTEALKTNGFGVITQIDVQAIFKEKLKIEQSPYLILGACNPEFAHQALKIDPNIGLLLPCNVVVREESSNNIIVTFMDPMIIANLANQPEITEIAKEIRKRLEQVKNCLFA
ncbi:MAG: DUF302 domain-containing protein [Gammaproteobacteria bacterium]